jgi:site-specific DNA recombinase
MTSARPRAVIYAHYSTDLQNEHSIRDQIAKCAEKAAREGRDVVDEFSDAAMSGSSNNRPGYQRMLSQLRSQRFNIVLTESLDRISRDQEDVAHFFKNARHHDVTIHTLDHGRISAMHIGFAGTMNALFLEGLTEKTHRGLEGRVKDGSSAGGRSYGYRVVHGGLDARGKPIRGGLEIDETEARIVQRGSAAGMPGVSLSRRWRASSRRASCWPIWAARRSAEIWAGRHGQWSVSGS